MSKYTMELVREIWSDEGFCLRIGADSDGLGLVEIREIDDTGKIVTRLSLEPEVARLLAEGLFGYLNESKKKSYISFSD